MGKREKSFAGFERRVPLDRNAKARASFRARALRRAGKITRAAEEVADALLFDAHNTRSGKCCPSYERLAELAGCARSTVAEAIKQLEAVGWLTWCHRIMRLSRELIVRSSNGYTIADPAQLCPVARRNLPKSDFRSGTPKPSFLSSSLSQASCQLGLGLEGNRSAASAAPA